MVIQPCGDLTGTYYLVISGLPWTARWQKLKDFIRYPETGGCINVEHVYIYSGTTDAWAQFRGKEDFQRAYEYLNGRVFEGKAITADNRNGHDLVNLRDLVPIQQSAMYQDHGGSSSPDSAHSTGYNSYPFSSTGYSHHGHIDFARIHTPPESSVDMNGQMDSYFGNNSPGSAIYSMGVSQSQYSPVYDSSSASFTPQFNYGPPATRNLFLASPPTTPVYAVPVAVGYTCLGPMTQLIPAQPPHMPPALHMQPPPAPMQPIYHYQGPAEETFTEETYQIIKNEARKIIITHLPHSITEKELCKLLERAAQKPNSRSSTQSEEYPIESIEILRHSDGKAKGHAFAVLSSPHVAQRVVEALHGSTFHGRDLKARLTKEGVAGTRHHPVTPSPKKNSAIAIVAPRSSTPPLIPPRSPCTTTEEPTTKTSQISMTSDCSTTSTSAVTEHKRERREREKPKSRTQDVESERERERSSRTKSRNSTRTPAVVDGSGGGSSGRRHR